MQQLYYSKKVRGYFLVCSNDDLNVLCNRCGNIVELGDYVFVHNSFDFTKTINERLCQNCIKKHRRLIYDEFITAEVSNIIPLNSSIVPNLPPELKISTTVFDAALSNKNIQADTSDAQTINNCKLIFNMDYEQQIEYKENIFVDVERELNDEEFKLIVTAKPIIEKGKYLENKEEKENGG